VYWASEGRNGPLKKKGSVFPLLGRCYEFGEGKACGLYFLEKGSVKCDWVGEKKLRTPRSKKGKGGFDLVTFGKGTEIARRPL